MLAVSFALRLFQGTSNYLKIMSRLQLTTAQKMDATADSMAVQTQRYIQNLNGLYREFWGNDQTETIAALNEDKVKSLADLLKHRDHCEHLNAMAEEESFSDRCLVGMPPWIAYDGVQWIPVQPQPIDPQPE